MAGLLNPGSHAGRSLPSPLLKQLLSFLAIAFLLAAAGAAGCAQESRTPDFSSPELLGYIASDATSGRIMVTSYDGGAGESLLVWRGYGERFSFSNDGRYLTQVLLPFPPGSKQGTGRFHVLVAATDGASARIFSGGQSLMSFSPDSKRLAYASNPVGGANEIGVIESATGEIKPLTRGRMLLDPVWVDDRTVLYTEFQTADYPNRADGGVIYRLDVETGSTTRLTPADKFFSAYNSPVSYIQPRVAITEKGPLYNLWSLEVAGGRLRQITNNTLYQFRAGYLPGGNRILFEQLSSSKDTMSSEVAMISEDGSGFTMISSDLYFDGVHTFSLASGRIAYQKKTDDGDTSIWLTEADGSGAESILDAKSPDRIGDPNFISVTGWSRANPLIMTVGDGARSPDQPLMVTVENTSTDTVEATLRSFLGLDVKLSAGELPAGVAVVPDASAPAPSIGEADQAFQIVLRPAQSVTISLVPQVRPTAAAPAEASLLLTLAVPGTPPRMYWQDFG